MKPLKIVILMLLSLSLAACGSKEVKEDSSTSPKAYYTAAMAEWSANPKHVDKMVIGDSNVTGWSYYDKFPVGWANRGIAADTTLGVMQRIEFHLTKETPNEIAFLVGITDIIQHPDYLMANYEQIIDKVQSTKPDTKIYVISILPATTELSQYYMINPFNQLIREMCERKGVKFCNANPIFYDGTTGLMKTSLYGDMLHPNAEGFGLLRDFFEQWYGGLGK